MEWASGLWRSKCIEGGNGYDSLKPHGSQDESLKKILPQEASKGAKSGLRGSLSPAAPP